MHPPPKFSVYSLYLIYCLSFTGSHRQHYNIMVKSHFLLLSSEWPCLLLQFLPKLTYMLEGVRDVWQSPSMLKWLRKNMPLSTKWYLLFTCVCVGSACYCLWIMATIICYYYFGAITPFHYHISYRQLLVMVNYFLPCEGPCIV